MLGWELMVEIISKFSRFSGSYLTISHVPANHHGAHAIEYLPFVCSQKPSQLGLQNFVIINPTIRLNGRDEHCPHSLGDKQVRTQQFLLYRFFDLVICPL